MTIAEQIRVIMDDLEQLGIDAQDIGMLGAAHKIESALGNLSSAWRAAQQWEEF